MKCIIFSFLIILWSLTSLAGEDYSNLVKNAGTAKEYPGSNVLVLFDSTDVLVKETGLSYVQVHTLVKILTSAGALSYSVVKFDYDPLSAWVEIKAVNIYRKNGSIETCNLTKVMDYPAPAGTILWGSREKMIETGRLEPGDAVEVKMFRKGFTYALLYDDDDKYIPPMKGHFYDIVPFWTSEPVIQKTYRVTLPASKPLQYKFYHGEVDSSRVLNGNLVTLTFSCRDIKPFKSEPNMVNISDVAPKLLLSTSPDWQAKSRWFYQVNEDYGSFVPTPEIKALVNDILKEAKNEMDSVSLLTHWAGDEIRYLGLSMGPGEGYTLHDGKTIYTDRCGVCKDKASILVTMLRAAGFEAYAAMTMAGSRIEYIPADQFNHSVTVVKLKDGKFHLLDPTWVPFVRELWSSREQQQNYLIGNKNGEDLMITPISPATDHYLYITGQSELSPDGSVSGTLDIEAEGQTDATFRSPLTRNFRSSWYMSFEAELKKDFPTMVIKELTFSDGYDYSKPFTLHLEYYLPAYAIKTPGQQMLFTPVTAAMLMTGKNSHLRINLSPVTRKYPFADGCSKYIRLMETIKIPEGFEVLSFPKADTVQTDAASYNCNYTGEGHSILLEEWISLNKRIYDPDDWPGFKNVVLAQKKLAVSRIVIGKKKEK